MDWITVTPAYGRDYKNQKEAIADWNANKDFRETFSGQYTNKEDCQKMGKKVIIRYGKLMKTMQAPMK